MPPKHYDFSGWATKNDLRCNDGRIIRRGAFIVNDGQTVPLVWNHQHNSPDNVLGHAVLENREDGVYAYCEFNESQKGKSAKEAVKHGDVKALSIWANGLTQNGPDVIHGNIREVSLVLAGSNPGAFIESVLVHGESIDEFDEEGIFYTDEEIVLSHSDAIDKPEGSKEDKKVPEEKGKGKEKEKEKTVKDVYDTLNEEQKKAVAIIVGMAIQDSKEESEKEKKEEGEEMKHNMFSDDNGGFPFISHSDMKQLIEDGRRLGSFKAALNQSLEDGILAHSIDTTGMIGPSDSTASQKYGLRDPEMLFPEFRSLQTQPEWISRNMGWVEKVMSRVHRTPFSRVKMMFADITEDEARARGYIKGNLKKEEVFTLLKRTVSPTTIYKKQKMDRDDILDITGFDVLAWIAGEMRLMLNEEIARSILIGDGRPTSSDDHIDDTKLIPIVKEPALFNTVVKVKVAANATEAEIAKATINAVIRSRKKYKGSGSPDFFTTEDVVTEMLLIEDELGHKLYKTEDEITTTLRAKEIIPVEVMEEVEIDVKDGETTKKYPLIGILVNLADYNVGADKGGEINMFEDFDIDYNQQKYLLETRISGALTKPFSAITLVLDKAGTQTQNAYRSGSSD